MNRARWLLVGAALLATSAAHAQSGSDISTAQALFEEGKHLMQGKRFDEACPKLVESQRLDPGGGTLFAIALCHEGQGKLATAWGDFNLAESIARKDHRTDREMAAHDHVTALDARLTKARIVVTAPPAGFELTRDGKAVSAAEFGTALPIDAGDHTFEAHAPGKKTWHATIALAGEGKSIDVVIPALDDEAKIAPVVAPIPTSTSTPTATSTPTPTPTSDGSSMRTIGFVTGGVSLAFVGVGLGFGASALSKWHDADTGCNGTSCTNPNAATQSASAGHAADVSTVLVTVGAVGLAASVALILFAPSSASSSSTGLRVSPMIGRANGIAIGGDL